MKVTDMPAGKAMNDAVAIHCMKWSVVTKPDQDPYWYGEDEENRILTGVPVDRWDPSEDIADAWEVAEKLRIAVVPCEYYGDWRWIAIPDNRMDAYVDAGLVNIESRPVLDDCGMAETTPLAICRAALIAVGVTEVEG